MDFNRLLLRMLQITESGFLSFSLTTMVWVGVTIMSTGKSCDWKRWDGRSSIIWQSWTVVTTIVSALTAPILDINANSRSAYPSPSPTLCPVGLTHTEPKTTRSTFKEKKKKHYQQTENIILYFFISNQIIIFVHSSWNVLSGFAELL